MKVANEIQDLKTCNIVIEIMKTYREESFTELDRERESARIWTEQKRERERGGGRNCANRSAIRGLNQQNEIHICNFIL